MVQLGLEGSLVVLLAVVVRTTDGCGLFNLDLNTLKKDSGLLGTPTYTVRRVTTASCLITCNDYPGCQFINHNPTTYDCNMYDADPGTTSPGSGLDYAPLSTMIKGGSLNACESHTCTAAKHHCVDDHGTQECALLPFVGIFETS